MATQDAELCGDCAGSGIGRLGDIEDSICSNCQGRGEIDLADLEDDEPDTYKWWRENQDD